MNLHRTVLLLLIGLLPLETSAAQIEVVEWWRTQLREKPIAAVAELMARPADGKAWPHIKSPYAATKMPPTTRILEERSLQLAEEFRDKLDASFKPEKQLDAQGLQREIETYRMISSALEKAGGYGNAVLQDSVCRLMIFRLSGWVVGDPRRAETAAQLLDDCQVPRVDLKATLLRLSSEDSTLDGKQAQIEAVAQDASVYQGMEPLGIGMNQVMAATLEIQNLRTSALLRESSAIRLIWRMTETEALRWVHLRGLIDFFKKGGSIAELNPSDITAFKRRMGDEVKQYKYPLLRIRRLSTDEPQSLVNLHKEAQVRDIFLATALK